MRSKLVSRCARLFGLVLFALGGLGATPAVAVTPSPADSATPTTGPSAGPSHTTLPPYSGDTAPRPVRTRTDRIISTIAPIAMVLVLAAGLYIYWLIRKGL
jgi:hypothetical protein